MNVHYFCVFPTIQQWLPNSDVDTDDDDDEFQASADADFDEYNQGEEF